ncbi:Spc24 subunit of Ndc80-domain-containing protein [Triangularia setosa]|uniref:Kinetochore protein Spc24 n=1 Tax=Triangularia setosa TaxID=2587417 RepID=A0AAN6WKR2_9PEZI|nr:Spc24 subunit of Ndc80-domain-containing protein [Podospora setosa]
MLLEEDPSTLIRHTITNFNTQPDRLAIARISESLSTLAQARDLRIREAESSLKKLSRQLSTLSNQHNELTSTHSSAAHASEISRLDTQKFRIAKSASDLEMETERLQSQLDELNARLQELEMQGVDGGDGLEGVRGGDGGVEDEVLLRLKVYRSLGMELEKDDKGGREGGEFNRVVLRNDKKGDVHVVKIDGGFSRFFYANYFWQNL